MAEEGPVQNLHGEGDIRPTLELILSHVRNIDARLTVLEYRLGRIEDRIEGLDSRMDISQATGKNMQLNARSV
jgi:hypothetical protein